MKVNTENIEWRIVLKDYRTEEVQGAFTIYGSEYTVLNRIGEIPKKYALTDTDKREVEIYY